MVVENPYELYQELEWLDLNFEQEGGENMERILEREYEDGHCDFSYPSPAKQQEDCEEMKKGVKKMPTYDVMLEFRSYGLSVMARVRQVTAVDEREAVLIARQALEGVDINDLQDITTEEVQPNAFVCPECGQLRPGDMRVANGMKCARCAYSEDIPWPI